MPCDIISEVDDDARQIARRSTCLRVSIATAVAIATATTIAAARRIAIEVSAIAVTSAIAFCALPVTAHGDEPTDWPLHGHGSTEQRHSPLDQIDRNNVDRLGLAFEFRDFVVRGRTHRGNEATPIAIDGRLYFTGPWSVVYAVDGVSGRLLWKYDPKVPGQWVRKACCDAVSRGVAVSGLRVYVATLDGYLDALDIENGKRIWRSDTLIDRSRAYTITAAPRMAGDRIVIGNGGGELGVRGYVSAFDLDGELAWRFFTVPGKGPDEHPEIAAARKTWSENAAWSFGLGGTVWDSTTYDPELGLIYVGTGNGSPWPAEQRSPGGGDNLYLSSILAIDIETGRLRWHYQTTPGDSWDYTATQQMILVDRKIDGRKRKLLLQAPKNGFFYVLDRMTGELISAKPYTEVNWASHIDLTSGRPVLKHDAIYDNTRRIVRPSFFGGHNWHPMSYSPTEGLVYIPVLESDMEIRTEPQPFKPDSINIGAIVDDARSQTPNDPFLDASPRPPQSRLVAWDPTNQREVWSSLPGTWWNGGVLSTAGNLVFQGAADGGLWIFDAKDGRALRRIETGSAILAAPISYQVDDVQYIAVLAGFGGAPKTWPPGSAPAKYRNLGRLLVFRLDGDPVPLPPLRPEPVIHTPHPQNEFDAGLANRGRILFLEHCARCHTERGVPNGYPNLWNLPAPVYDALVPIVLDGAMADAGMPGFDDLLSEDDIISIREYLLRDEALFGHPGSLE